MDQDTATIIFVNDKEKRKIDIEVPLDITANELFKGLNIAYQLGADITDTRKCYLVSENPIAFLKGNRTLSQYRIHDGTIIYYKA